MPGLTRRHALFAIGAATMSAHPARADMGALEEAANKEGTLTWYIAQVDAVHRAVSGGEGRRHPNHRAGSA